MKILSGLMGILTGLLAAAAILLVLGLLVSQGITRFITPPPEQVAEGLVKALGAHRFEGVMEQLSQEIANQATRKELADLIDAIESSNGGIQDASGQEAQQQGETASASVDVKTKNLQEFKLDFPLKQENGLWKVTSIDPLRKLISK